MPKIISGMGKVAFFFYSTCSLSTLNLSPCLISSKLRDDVVWYVQILITPENGVWTLRSQ